MKLVLDLHVHTCYSQDSFIGIEELLPRSRAAGIDGVAVTDHETLEGSLRAREVFRDFLVIPGIEIETLNGHVLGLDVEKPVRNLLGLEETVREIHGQGGLAVIAHPFSFLKPKLSYPQLQASQLDAVEAVNSGSFPFSSMSRRNRDLASLLSLPVTGGSDAHIPQVIGRAYTVVDTRSSDISDVVEAIRQGRTEALGYHVTFQERVIKSLRQVRKVL